ncbi:hypothetical protein AX17_003750 [Amanita inopinata Kibby_2008]|nr:hypothetical protein AX17_003750 [Amanita inopinata Kibby_2008]
MTLTFQHVQKPTEEQVEVAVALFVDLMKNETATRSLCGGDAALMPDMVRSALKAGIYAAGEFYIATDEEGAIVGFTLWMPPGQDMFSTPDERELGLNDFMTRLSDAGREYYRTTYMVQFPEFVNGLLGPRGKTDAWWLHMAMVRRDQHRKGVAMTLIDMVRKKAAESEKTLAVATTKDPNILFYQKCGFKLMGSKMMPSQWGDWPLHILSLAPPGPVN